MKKKEDKKEAKKAESKLLKMVDDKSNDLAVEILKMNKRIKKFAGEIDEMHRFMEEVESNDEFANQRVISNRIQALKRLLYATKIGLDRQKFKLYDIDKMTLKEKIINEME